MGTIPQILLTSIVAAAVGGFTAWGVIHYKPSSPPPENTLSEEVEFQDESPADFTADELQQMLADFSTFPEEGADTNDPAYTDEAIADMSADATASFVRQAIAYLEGRPKATSAEYFALGRVALLHKYPQVAEKYLSEAAFKGYAAAHGYLGDPLITANAKEQWAHYARAVELGFAPARDWKESLEMDAIAAIERFTADNQDPQLPADVHGISNMRVMAWSSAEIDALIEDYGFFAEQPQASAHLAYGLGRAAFFHQNASRQKDKLSTARKYLEIAANKGSVAAMSYLAYEEFTTDLDVQFELLKKSAEGGYQPAKRRFEDAIEHKTRIDLSRKNHRPINP
jgi:hypothetical protein